MKHVCCINYISTWNIFVLVWSVSVSQVTCFLKQSEVLHLQIKHHNEMYCQIPTIWMYGDLPGALDSSSGVPYSLSMSFYDKPVRLSHEQQRAIEILPLESWCWLAHGHWPLNFLAVPGKNCLSCTYMLWDPSYHLIKVAYDHASSCSGMRKWILEFSMLKSSLDFLSTCSTSYFKDIGINSCQVSCYSCSTLDYLGCRIWSEKLLLVLQLQMGLSHG